MFKKTLSFLIALFVLFGAFMPIAAAHATTLKWTSGKITAVNTVAKTLTVVSKSGKLIKFKVNSTSTLKRNGRIVRLKNMQVGDKFSGTYNPTTKVAASISGTETLESHGEVYGTVAAVDMIANTITITPGSGAADLTLVVDANTDLQRNNASAELSDFVVGDAVEAHYEPATMIATEIHADFDEEGDEDSDLYGIVAAVDAAAGTITLSPVYGGANLTLAVDADTEFERFDADATLADFLVGDRVKAEYDPATMIAAEIDCE